MQSQRVNVTISRRVSSNDAFIARAWSAPTGQPVARSVPVEPQAPGYGGSSYPPLQSTTSNTATVATATAAATVATAAVTEASAATRAADAAERAATAAERVADQAERRAEEPVIVAAPVAAAPVVAAPVAAAPQPAATPQPTAEPAVPVDDRRLRARLKQLDDARAAGLISDAEFEARRQALLGTG
ncbi:MAG: SHOCT domain-containing protein [Alphaproteobacteria bacterium]|nr:SHOCT domain-containing protein [Alphaproteobacteria bacterium]